MDRETLIIFLVKIQHEIFCGGRREKMHKTQNEFPPATALPLPPPSASVTRPLLCDVALLTTTNFAMHACVFVRRLVVVDFSSPFLSLNRQSTIKKKNKSSMPRVEVFCC